MSSETDRKLAASLTAEDTDLLPFLPYLLQDLWQLGGSPDLAVLLLEANMRRPDEKKVLDLACGKGAIAVRLAAELGAQVKGVDLLPEFIAYAREKAVLHQVADLCTFQVGDVNAVVQTERDWDAVVFSAAGNVLGPPAEMLPKLKGVVKRGGLILLDESYLDNTVERGMRHAYEYSTKGHWDALFKENGLEILAAYEFDDAELAKNNRRDLAAIQQRAAELVARHPEKQALFDGYVQSQQDEGFDLENSLVNVVWLLKSEG